MTETHTPWHLLLLLLQATSRLLRSLVGVRQKPPTPSEAVNPAVQTRDIYRLLHENIQYYRGSFQHSPLSSEVGGWAAGARQAGWGPGAAAGAAACAAAGGGQGAWIVDVTLRVSSACGALLAWDCVLRCGVC